MTSGVNKFKKKKKSANKYRRSESDIVSLVIKPFSEEARCQFHISPSKTLTPCLILLSRSLHLEISSSAWSFFVRPPLRSGINPLPGHCRASLWFGMMHQLKQKGRELGFLIRARWLLSHDKKPSGCSHFTGFSSAAIGRQELMTTVFISSVAPAMSY